MASVAPMGRNQEVPSSGPPKWLDLRSIVRGRAKSIAKASRAELGRSDQANSHTLKRKPPESVKVEIEYNQRSLI